MSIENPTSADAVTAAAAPEVLSPAQPVPPENAPPDMQPKPEPAPSANDPQSTPTQPTPTPTLTIDAAIAPKLSLADFQNAVPWIRELAITNHLAHATGPLVLSLSSTPAFVQTKTWRLESIGAGACYPIADRDVQLDAALLTQLTEAQTATITLSVQAPTTAPTATTTTPNSDPLATTAITAITIELLPRNQWGGLAYLPDMVAAFVQPNDPAVDRVLKQTAALLREHGKDPALDGYTQGGPQRAWEFASAVWGAIASMRLDYALPPASFEHHGQKIRSATHIADAGLGTCLDLALLFCSVIEQIGLNPLVVFTRGHAFAGVWLKPQEFSTSVVDDVTALRKRLKLQELILVETTLLTQQPAVRLSRAIEAAAEHIAEGKDDLFELAVDIRRARLQRIKPLASPHATPTAPPGEATGHEEVIFEVAPNLPNHHPDDVQEAVLDPKDRLARWQRKLLDLSLRNNLLNFKASKKALTLNAPDPGQLEDVLSDGKEIKILPRPDLMSGNDPRSQTLHEQRDHENLSRQFALDALRRREVFIELPKDELESRMVDLYRTARATLQEGGSNTLFLAVGFLTWNRADKQETTYRAPLILIPVALKRRSVRSGFTLVLHDDEPLFNPTLIEMLRQDFQLNLGMAGSELPRDEAGLDINAIWKTVSVAIKDIAGWEVSEEIVLSRFSFAKYLMWVDLVHRTNQLRQSPVVKHLLDTPRDPYPSSTAFPDPRSLDQDYAPQEMFCPLPADSSQLSAVMAAAKGKNFVLIGPPGTGKSQTISNLIAQCLAERKRVLFVSEKIAALDVVYRRLREVGLGDFCLELHSSKARKVDVLAQLKNAWDAQGEVDAELWQQEAQRLKQARDELNRYVEKLHHRYANGRSIYEAIGIVVDGAEVAALPLSWPSHSAHTRQDTELLAQVIARLEVNALAVGTQALTGGPFTEVEHAQWSPSWQQGFIEAARQLLPVCNSVVAASERFQTTLGLAHTALTQATRGALASLAQCLPQAAGRDWTFAFAPNAQATSEHLLEGKALLERHAALSQQLSAGWSPAIQHEAKAALALLQQRQQVHASLAAPWSPLAIESLRQGIALLQTIQRQTQSLSVRYSDAIEHLNVYQLEREHAKASTSVWPLSWLGQRKVRQQLETAIAGQGEPQVPQDLMTWVAIRDARSALEKLDIPSEMHSVWHGLKSRVDILQAADALQSTLKAVHAQGGTWSMQGLEPLLSGHGGDGLVQEVRKLEKIAQLDSQLGAFSTLAAATDQLWAGLNTNLPALENALAFTHALAGVRTSGSLPAGFEPVAQGTCGERLAQDHALLQTRQGIEDQLLRLGHLAASCPDLWKHLETTPADLANAAAFQRTIAASVAHLASSPEQVPQVYGALGQLVTQGNALLHPEGPVAAQGAAYLKALEPLQPCIDNLGKLGAFSAQSASRCSDTDVHQLRQHCQAIIAAENKLNAWCAWRKVSQQAMVLGLAPIVDGLVSGAIAPANVRRAFETNYCRWWLNAAVDSEPIIRTFVSAEHEQRIIDFRALDQRFTDLTRAWLKANLCKSLPSQNDVTRNSEWGFLKHEITKKRAHKPLRELMSNLPTALTQLTPCLLMSPLSIAQYLAADTVPFDVVVFDEASQIPVWDAIGAIARGKQVVMVGDPKQLPPSNFFERAESIPDDQDTDTDSDMESILDECMGASLPTLGLTWHYRSRHESLIAFSNHRYYGGKLVTFPSPVTEDRAVSLHWVQGVYDKGGARTNQAEAKALVADIVSRLKSPGFRASKLTIGVVTFNTEQQKLIEDLLDEERRQDPGLEPYFAESELEPLFVKNLESVQGDERDIMYFSITYGPDSVGNVSMNFGPMNRTGGERRLNVAITRARQALRVFSSIQGDQIDLSRTQATGVRDLKHFLDFARHGSQALLAAHAGSLGGFESPFEAAVAGALAAKGWTLHTQVGVSAFRIDLAVVHPDAPGSYLTGIECDGATYHRSATARDRDLLREQVLRKLGWEIVRIWSTDWWVDPRGTLERIAAQLDGLLIASRAKRAAADATTAATATVAATTAADTNGENADAPAPKA